MEPLWEKEVYEFIVKYAYGVCVDVGAATGVYTELMASHPSVERVHAFEPHPYNIQKLKDYTDPKIVVHPYALGKNDGTVAFKTKSFTKPRAFPWLLAIKKGLDIDYGLLSFQAPVKRLDSILKHIDFMKVDTEGMEYDVLRGANRLLEGTFVTVELHRWGDYDKFQIIKLIQTTHTWRLEQFADIERLFLTPKQRRK